MKKFIQLSSLILLFACNNSPKKPEAVKPENGLDAATKFIRAALDGEYGKARTFLVTDSTNKQTMDTYENYYNNNTPPEDKRAYKTASIRFPNDPRIVNDSVTIIHYSNSHKNQLDSLKVVRINGQWLIDLEF